MPVLKLTNYVHSSPNQHDVKLAALQMLFPNAVSTDLFWAVRVSVIYTRHRRARARKSFQSFEMHFNGNS